jgi:EpsI family protein
MTDRFVVARMLAVAVLLGATHVIVSRAAAREAPVTREPLALFPHQLGPWIGSADVEFSDDVVAQAGVDDYVNRQYVRADAGPVALYVGYYGSQRQGDAIHSPQNCLPGAGWQPIEAGYTGLPATAGGVRVNRYVIQKGIDRQLVLYWYQGRGRTVANEYTNKLLLMWDAARLHRTNAALVRIITPIVTDVSQASNDARQFAAALLPLLPRYVP